MNQENINCQSLLKAGHLKSGTYVLKDVSEEKPRLAFCNMKDGGVETEIQGLQGPPGPQGLQGKNVFIYVYIFMFFKLTYFYSSF